MTFCQMALKVVAPRFSQQSRQHLAGLVKNNRVRKVCFSQARRCDQLTTTTLPWADRLRAFQEDLLESENSSDGWLYGYALDGRGGARKLDPWDVQVCDYLSRLQRQDGDIKGDEDECDGDVKGYWIHIDFTRSKNIQWVWDVVQSIGRTNALVDAEDVRIEDMRTLWLSRLAEDDRVSLPRCEISFDNDAMFLSFRVGFLETSLNTASALSSDCGMNVVELRVCLTKGLLLTTRIAKFPEGYALLPEIEESLLEGRGGKSCGELAAMILDRGTAKSTSAARDAYESVLGLRTRFQGKSLANNGNRPIGRKELASLSRKLSLVRYDATRLSRNLTQQRASLQTLSRFANKRKQKIFSRADATRIRQAFERQDALEETLEDVGDSSEVLHAEIMTHINWGTAEGTYRLTILGGVCSVMIIINIVVSLYEFSERQKLRLQLNNAKYLEHYFKVNNVS